MLKYMVKYTQFIRTFLLFRIAKTDDLKDEVYEIDTEVDQVDEVTYFAFTVNIIGIMLNSIFSYWVARLDKQD